MFSRKYSEAEVTRILDGLGELLATDGKQFAEFLCSVGIPQRLIPICGQVLSYPGAQPWKGRKRLSLKSHRDHVERVVGMIEEYLLLDDMAWTGHLTEDEALQEQGGLVAGIHFEPSRTPNWLALVRLGPVTYMLELRADFEHLDDACNYRDLLIEDVTAAHALVDWQAFLNGEEIDATYVRAWRSEA